MREDLFVTTATERTAALGARLRARADALAAELGCGVVARANQGMTALFAALPSAQRALVVQERRLLLVARDGWEFFFHPNMAYLRLGNLLRGGRDLLIEAADLRPGDAVLDATLGLGAEAILCAHVVGDTGEVHGVEAAPEMGVAVREGLATRVTAHRELNAAMRRVRVVHLGHHLEFLRGCPDGRYDVICFDPFFDRAVDANEALGALRAFGELAPLQREAVEEARRVARRRVVIKAVRWSPLLGELGVDFRVESHSSKVAYGVLVT